MVQHLMVLDHQQSQRWSRPQIHTRPPHEQQFPSGLMHIINKYHTCTVSLTPIPVISMPSSWSLFMIIIILSYCIDNLYTIMTFLKQLVFYQEVFDNICRWNIHQTHNNDVIMSAMMASQITSHTFVYSTVYSGADQRKHQSSASLSFVRGIHRWPMNSPHIRPVTRKMFPFDDVIMILDYHSTHWFSFHF